MKYHRPHRYTDGFTLVELLVYTVIFSMVLLVGIQLIGTFTQSNARISNYAKSSLDIDTTLLRINTLLADTPEVDVCNVYKTDTSLDDTQELTCPPSNDNIRDGACIVTRGNNKQERWGVELSDREHMAIDYRSTISSNSDLSISLWLKDATCSDSDGCIILQLGHIDENAWWPNANADNDRVALIAKNNSGDLELSLSTQKIYSSNKSITYPVIERTARTLGTWNSGDWTHIVLTLEHDDSALANDANNTDLEFGTVTTTVGSDTVQDDLSFNLYVNGLRLLPNNVAISSEDLDIDVNQALLFGEYRAMSYLNGLIGPIQIFDEAIDTALIARLNSEFYLPAEGDFNLSMKWEDFGSTSVFTRPSSEFLYLNFAATAKEPICNGDAAMGADEVRICRSFTDADSYYEQYETSVVESDIGRSFLFAKDTDTNSTLNWDERPYALYSHQEANNFCLSEDDPGQNTDPESTGWKKLTDFKFFPGQDSDGNDRFFNKLENSDFYQLLASTEYRGNQGLVGTGALTVKRKLKDNALCQIAPDNINFSIPTSAESTCDLRYAQVVIQDGWQPLIDMLYIQPTSGYKHNDDFDPSDTTVTCTTSTPFESGKNVHGCRKATSAPDGNTYSQYIFKEIPLLADSARAVYDAQFGTLTIDAGAGNTPDAETWYQVLKQVSYTTQDGIPENQAYEKYRTILFSLGDRIPFYPDDDPNGKPHYYDYIVDANVHWDEARFDASAASAKFCGLQGYLASITSESENDFIYSRFANNDGSLASGWIGGTDHHNWASQSSTDPALDDANSSQEGNWRWVDGPEHGEVFWRYSNSSSSNNIRRTGRFVVRDDNADVSQCYLSGETDSSLANAELDRFTTGILPPSPTADRCAARPGPACNAADYWFVNWAVFMDSGSCRTSSSDTDTNVILAEPNQSGNEHYLQITGQPNAAGTWNDLPHDDTTTTITSPYYIGGYYIEYGGCSGSPCINNASDSSELSLTARERMDISALRQLCDMPNK